MLSAWIRDDGVERSVSRRWRRCCGTGDRSSRPRSGRGCGTYVHRAQSHRRGFRAPARCRSEAPTGRTGQRSRPSEPPHLLGVRAETELSRRLGWAPPRPCGPLCRPEVGVPSRPRAFSRLAMGVSRPCGPLCRAPLGGLPGGRGSKASSRLFSVCGARHSRWQDGASSARVSRSRAMPVGDRRSSRPGACSRSVVRGTHGGGRERHRRGFRASARCRSETGAPAVLALVLGLWCAALTLVGWSVIGAGFAFPRDAGRRPALQRGAHAGRRERHWCGFRASARCRSETGAPAWRSCWQERASSARVSRSRAMPVGDRRSSRPGACSRSVVHGTHAGRMERHRRGFRAPARCRSETGAPGRARACSPSAVRGTQAGRAQRHRRGFRAPARCRSETGAPGRARACSRSVVRGTHGGGMERYRYWFRAPARCRSEDRRSWPCAALTVAGGNVIGAGFALPRDAGLKTGAPGGGLYQMEAGGPGRRPLGGVPAESSTPVGERTALPADRRRWRSPAVPRRSCSSRWSRCSGRSSRGSTG